MSMSRKDFELLARVIKDTRHNAGVDIATIEHVAEHIATALNSASSTFQKDRFLAACRPKEQK